jgi:hypothetical protein
MHGGRHSSECAIPSEYLHPLDAPEILRATSISPSRLPFAEFTTIRLVSRQGCPRIHSHQSELRRAAEKVPQNLIRLVPA